MPTNASQQEIGRLRELVRNKSKSPAVRIKHSKTLWSLYPSANNRRIIQTGLKRILPLAEERDRREALELLNQMEGFTPAAKPPCLVAQARPSEPAKPTGLFWDDGPTPADRMFQSIFGEPQVIEHDETRLSPKPFTAGAPDRVLPEWDGFTTLDSRFRGRTFPQDMVDGARERISNLIVEFGIDADGTASLESYRELEDVLWEKRSRLAVQRNLPMPSDDFEFVALTNSIADLWVAWLSHCRPEKKIRFTQVPNPLSLSITDSENEEPYETNEDL